jgi:ribosomal-protein-alanine N-acetyltransferase
MGSLCEQIIIVPMAEHDLPEVMVIETASYSHPWTADHFLQEMQSPYAFPLAAFDGKGTLAGYICPMLLLDEGHILNVAVRPECRGQGIGKYLVERALDDCRLGGAAFVSLEVRPSNLSALTLYRSLGFTETGLRKKYYQDGEDAILMEYIILNREQVDAV